MQIVVVGRHTDVPEKFRRHAEEKLEKVTQLAPRAQRVDVELTQERNPRQSASCHRVELTVRAKGPVIRAEASADDRFAAFELALTKLLERLRRAHDRRKGNHRAALPPVPAGAPAALVGGPVPDPAAVLDGAVTDAAQDADEPQDPFASGFDGSPVVIREKTHEASPMTLDDALYEMELVGHDFYLYVDAETAQPAVVYRRRGWSYGVIRLDASVELPRQRSEGLDDGTSDGVLARAAVAGPGRG